MAIQQKKTDCIEHIKNAKGDRAADWVRRVLEAMDNDTAEHYIRSLLDGRSLIKEEEEETKEEEK